MNAPSSTPSCHLWCMKENRKHVLVIGAGRSATVLIDYLIEHAEATGYAVTVADMALAAAEAKTAGRPHAQAVALNLQDEDALNALVRSAEVVVSLAPPDMHPVVAAACLAHKAHLVTASYVSPAMRAFHEEALAKGLLFLNEMGCDPGLDHMSAMELLARIREAGGTITSFKSYTGGLVAPESDDNAWHYKISWNPRNVILAGNGLAEYQVEGRQKYISYQRLFAEAAPISVPGFGMLDAYANRDSLSYKALYGLEDIQTILRATLRYPGYCQAWNVLIQLGMTFDGAPLHLPQGSTLCEFLEMFLPANLQNASTRDRFETFVVNDGGQGNVAEIVAMFDALGFFGSDAMPLVKGTPAQLLQAILEPRWKLYPGDKDALVMHHEIEHTDAEGQQWLSTASLIEIGADDVHTAMAKTVGLPAAIAVRLLLEGALQTRGVAIPTVADIYVPVLRELAENGIVFTEARVRR